MKQKLLITVIILPLLLSCKHQVVQSEGIDVEHGIQNPTRLKISDFGKTIRYIPLETTDDGLVGNRPVVKVLKNYIVTESQGSCLLFDKKDGSFIAKIGRIGQGPNEYSDIFSWTDEKEEYLYFNRRSNQLVKYDMKGVYHGKIEFPTLPGSLASYYLITDSEIIGYFNGMGHYTLGFFDKVGILKDTIPSLFPNLEFDANKVASISVLRGGISTTYGNWSKTGAIIIEYKDDTKQILAPNATKIWKHNGHIHFKEDFMDTVYRLSGSQLVPSIIFNTGKYHWPVAERTSKKRTNERIFISDVSENDNFVFFQCIRGLYSDDPILYNGLYQKKTGETKFGKFSDPIEDDLTQFMPFTPLGMSTSGEFVSIIQVENIIEWLEKHPEAKNNAQLPFLKNLDEEMNPIVVLIE